MLVARKVILHGLFDGKTILMLSLFPWILPKCHWVIWGGDLYHYKSAKRSWRYRVKEVFRRFVIRRIGYFLTYIKGDIDLVRKWYGAEGLHQECLMYLSNVVESSAFAFSESKGQKLTLKVLVGNSADPSNNHLETFRRLSLYKHLDMKVYTPLSYGDQQYAKEVMRQGYRIFGNSFIPMTEFIPFNQYKEFLASVDIAIFNHQRQQAMGNTITLLGMGKTVYIRSDVSQWRLFEESGVKVFDSCLNFFDVLNAEDKKNNMIVIRDKFSRENLVKQYKEVFEN
ncbi:4-alpha-L-fucosyltransferase [Halomonas litopenaei]|nr:4-alpha-L-fucosyltransferase [Halomonas litopenaei]